MLSLSKQRFLFFEKSGTIRKVQVNA